MKSVKTAWIFDVDGVLSNLVEEKITQPQNLDYLVKILTDKNLLIFNTGRSISWVSTRILDLLLPKVQDKTLLKNFFIATEMGGMWTIFNDDYSPITYFDKSIKIPYVLKQKTKEIVRDKYSLTSESEEKQTMITTKIKTGSSLESYQSDQKKLVIDLKKLIDDFGFSDELMVGTTNTGTNIQSKAMGKRKAIERTIDWISNQNIIVDKFITIGDSVSDLDMPIKLNELNFPVEFVFVGEKVELAGKSYPFKITVTKELYEKGTLEFLKSLETL